MPKATAYQAVCDQVAVLLRAERLRQKLSLSAVAARSGLSYQMISYVERNLRVPGLGHVAADHCGTGNGRRELGSACNGLGRDGGLNGG